MGVTEFVRRVDRFALLVGMLSLLLLLLLPLTSCDRGPAQAQQADLSEKQGASIATSASAGLLPFQGAPNLNLPGVTATAGLSAADFDGDGRLDLAVLSGKSARLMIVLNTADGYRPAGEIDAGASASDCVTADFNEDGKPDLAAPHHDTPEVSLLLGNGAGTFQAPKKIRVAVKKPHLHMLAVGDVNRDGHADLLLAQSDDNAVWVLLGDGKAGFAPTSGSPVPTGQHPYIVATSDFDGDGDLDFATPNWFGKSVSVFLGDGRGDFAQAPKSPIKGFAEPIAVAAADLTGDGKVDLALGNNDSRVVQILVGDGKGSFVVGAIPDLEAAGDCFAPTLADLDSDGKTDVIATAVNGAKTFSYWINLGGGKFSPGHSLPCPAVASRIRVTDLNGDAAPDLIVGTWDEAKVCIWFGKKTKS